MKVDIHKLKTIMYERKTTQTELAKKLKIDRGTLTTRFKNNGLTFQLKEVYSIIRILELSKEEIELVFLCQRKEDDVEKYII